MRHGDDRAFVLLKVLFEPVDRLGVEVVGRLVQQQYVGLLQQQAAQGHAAPFAARQHGDLLVGLRAPQGVHRAIQHAVDLPAVGVVDLFVEFALAFDHAGHFVVRDRLAQLHVDLFVFFQQCDRLGAAFFDRFAHRLFGVELRLLLQVAHRVARREDHFALEVFVHAGDDLHQSRFSRAVQTDDADLGAIEKREVDVVEYFFLVGEHLGNAHHREDDFFVCHITEVVVLSDGIALHILQIYDGITKNPHETGKTAFRRRGEAYASVASSCNNPIQRRPHASGENSAARAFMAGCMRRRRSESSIRAASSRT